MKSRDDVVVSVKHILGATVDWKSLKRFGHRYFINAVA